MRVLKWELLGILFIIFVGSALHFIFELSGYSAWVAPFAAVNESVWEHLKLGFWPAVFFAPCEYLFLKKRTCNFVIAKTAAMYVIPLGIVLLFYLYTALLGHNVFAIDVIIFIIAVIIGQMASYRVLTSSELSNRENVAALAAGVFLAVIFLVFTFYPPHVFIFQDLLTGGYGIP